MTLVILLDFGLLNYVGHFKIGQFKYQALLVMFVILYDNDTSITENKFDHYSENLQFRRGSCSIFVLPNPISLMKSTIHAIKTFGGYCLGFDSRSTGHV